MTTKFCFGTIKKSDLIQALTASDGDYVSVQPTMNDFESDFIVEEVSNQEVIAAAQSQEEYKKDQARLNKRSMEIAQEALNKLRKALGR